MSKRVDGLNFIRIIGMSMILLFHAKLMYGFSVGILWMDQMISIAAIFVTVFFMLSGFGLRKSNGGLSCFDKNGLGKYYKKRILAIYPLFMFLQIVALLFQYRFADSLGETLALLPIQFSMLHILFGKEMHGFLFNDNCWYISALFVLYLLFPFLNELVNRLKTGLKWALCVFLWVLSVGIYFYCAFGTDYAFLDYYPNPFLRIPEFMIGMMLADLSEEVDKKRTSKANETSWLTGKKSNVFVSFFMVAVAVIATVCLTLLYPYFNQETNLYNLIVIPCTAVIFLCVANWDWLNRIGSKPVIRWTARLGLEMYLCQSFAIMALEMMKVDGRWDEIWFIGLSIMFSILVKKFFTKPIIKMARK